MLTDAERNAFSAWLTARVNRAIRQGRSKKSIAAALGDDSSQRLNRYLVDATSGKTPKVPTALVLARMSDAIDVPWPEAFLRAGYFREVLGVVDRVAAFAVRHSGHDHAATTELREMVVAFALDAFPRRDVRRIADASYESMFALDEFGAFVARDLAPVDKNDIAELTSHLDPLLGHAAEALGQFDVPALLRRAVAGEYVNAWADLHEPAAAARVRARQRLVSAILEKKG